MNLFGIIVPEKEDKRFPLYLRVRGGYDLETGAMEEGCVVSADTYFGCFSAPKYARYTTASDCECVLVVKGNVLAELISSNGSVLASVVKQSARPCEIILKFNCRSAGANEIFYPRVTALEKGSAFFGGLYRTTAPETPVKVAMVVCTYKREEFVRRNAKMIERLIKDASSGVSGKLELFVIDNGNTLGDSISGCEQIRVFPNRNTGGSGGFTRGMIEVIKRGKEFTHILLSDDDIEFDENVIIKTISFLSLLKPKYANLHIAGGMLNLRDPVCQFEAGARREGINLPNKHLQLDTTGALIANDAEETADYGGWWFFCIPASVVSKRNLPMPYFIKDDDVEFSIRNNARITTMNGIGVWHQEFGAKYVPYLDYYIIRNGMITNAIHGMKNMAGGTKGLVLERICRSIIFGMPQANKFCTMALRDYLKGPDFLFNTDCEALNTELRGIGAEELPELHGTPKENKKAMLRAVFTSAFWKVISSYIAVGAKYLLTHRRADKQYRERSHELVTLENWNRIL